MSNADNRKRPRWVALMVGAILVAYAGFLTHNLADLPGQTPLDPESLIPALITLALFVLWLVPITRMVATWALLGWAVLHLIGGGILSVLPIGLFPFEPEQTWTHYAFHVVYTITQVPLVWVCVAWLRRRPDGPGGNARKK